MASYLLLQDGGKLLLQDGGGILLSDDIPQPIALAQFASAREHTTGTARQHSTANAREG